MTRYLVVSGPKTALRLAVPAYGTVVLGADRACEVRSTEAGVAPRHAELVWGDGLIARALADDTAVVHPDGTRERPLLSGHTAELGAEERLRAGPLDVALVEGGRGPSSTHRWPHRWPHRWDRAVLEARLSSASSGVVLRATGDPESLDRLEARARPVGLVAAWGPDELALFLPDGRAADAERLVEADPSLRFGLAELGADDRLRALERAVPCRRGSFSLTFEDPSMRAVERLIAQAATCDEPVLILGETGTGKDRWAAELHRRSRRRGGPIVRRSSVSFDDTGLEGAAEAAAGGTLVLDEVSALTPRAQLAVALDLERELPIRVVAVSNQDLEALVDGGGFRRDLYYRLARFRIEIPPLRSRPGDVERFVQIYLDTHEAPAPSRAALDALLGYRWPGNLRELEGTLARALMASGGRPILLEHLPAELTGGAPPTSSTAEPTSLRDEMLALERRRILEALEAAPNQTEAAKLLGVPLRTFLNRLDALGIARPRKR